MTDRELLELAAKAAGIECEKTPIGFYLSDEDRNWNPLTDDGDALRLAVKLGLQTGPNSASREPMCFAWARDKGGIGQYEYYGNDPYAATRRAITRAAAEIGKAKCE
jgi:hypothetical protein